MTNTTFLRLELGIDAKQIASQIMVDNRNIESNIENGIKRAMDSITSESSFEDAIMEATKSAIMKTVEDVLTGWDIRNRISKVINEKISDAIGEYGEKLAEKVIQSLNNPPAVVG